MRAATALLYQGCDGQRTLWSLSSLEDHSIHWWQGESLQELARAWPELVEKQHARVAGCAIAGSTDNFFFDTFSRAEVAGATRYATLRYRLEADLPLSAEEMICDFQIGASSGQTACISAVAVDRAQWLSLIEHWQQSSCTTQLLIPKSLSLVQALVEDSNRLNSNSLVLLHIDGQYEIVALVQGQVIQWRLCGTSDNAQRDWRMACAQFPTAKSAVVLTSEPNELHSSVERIVEGAAVPLLCVDEASCLRQQINRYLSGRSTPWFNLAQDEQFSGGRGAWNHPQKLQRWLTVCALWILALALACYWRAERVRGVIATLKSQQTELVQAALPEQKLTSAIMARLKSEHAKLRGSRTTNTAVQLPISVLPLIRQVIDSLPVDAPISLIELRLEGDQVYLDVELASFEDAGLLAQALQAGGLNMSPPSTSSDKDGKVRAQLRGTGQPVSDSASGANTTLKDDSIAGTGT